MYLSCQWLLAACFAILSIFFSDFLTAHYRHQLSVCAMFKNEAPYLKEWIEFHMLVGVDHFYLYNNLSSDNYKQVLKPYIERGQVELIEWPYKGGQIGGKVSNPFNWTHVQIASYNDALKRATHVTKWLAAIDIDEFMLPVKNNNLLAILSDYEEFGGVCINWQLFGTSRINKIPKNKLLIETLLLKATMRNRQNTSVKSIVRPERVVRNWNIHRFKYKPGFFDVLLDKKRFQGKHQSPYVVARGIRINHYWTRDEQYFRRFKLARKTSLWTKKATMDRYYMLNKVKDLKMLRFASALRKKMYAHR